MKYFIKEEIEELKSIFVERHVNTQEDISGIFNVHVHTGWLPSQPVEEKPKCPKCGIVLESVMMYACMNEGCPTGLGGLNCQYGRL